ncbi:MAG: helix-turn-helix transcriptional regulator [Dehalobacter sp. 4CP]|nr:helix-turn-helix transcriptional regulator [Dehalobacter sp. 4CP]
MKLSIPKMQLAMANSCMSMGELAVKSGVTETSIRRIKNCQMQPRPKTIGKIAKALNIKVEDLIDVGDAE